MASKKEDWMQSKWRPMMGWVYMVTCTADFILFPVMWSILQSVMGANITQWNPITLQGAGLYHLAMGAVLGVAAWSRGQEKMAGATGGSPNGFSPSGGFGGPGMNNNNFGNSSWGGSGGMGQNWGNQMPNTAPNNWGNSQPTQGFNRMPAASSMPYNNDQTPLPAPATKPGVRLSDNPSARVILPEENNDADQKIR